VKPEYRQKGSVSKKKSEQSKAMPYRWRIKLLQLLFISAGLVICFRIVDLQVMNRTFLQGEGNKRSIRHESLPAHRGVVFDRNGKILAVSAPVATVWADPQDLIKEPGRWDELAYALQVNKSQVASRVKQNASKEFMYLKRQMTPEQGNRIKALKIPGVHVLNEQRRYYPMGEVTAHLVGITGIDDKGQEGLELGYDHWLTGTEGTQRLLKDRRGRLAREAELVKSAEPGNELMLSIDSRLQYMAYRELKKAVEKNKASAGSLVMIDVQTGEVLAMVNQPSYNPNNRKGLEAYRMRNRVMTDIVEPGSTLKPFTVAAALESGKYDRYTEVKTGVGYMRVGRNAVRDVRGYGTIDVETVLKKSSNIGVSKMALDIGADTLVDMLRRIGFGQSPGTGFPGERAGYLPYKDRWSDIEIATLSFGYGLTVTPLQLAQAYSVLGAGGILRPISLIKRDVAPDGIRVMDEKVADDVLSMLGKVVGKGGTGWRGAVKSYNVAGKTGTVKKVGGSGYSDDRYIGLFAGVAPVENPRIATVVIIDDPAGDQYYGGVIAGPVFSKVNGQALRMLGVRPKEEKVLTAGRPSVTPKGIVNFKQDGT
jgi:cell division protein FtsI (penicillin-binding protein 3)